MILKSKTILKKMIVSLMFIFLLFSLTSCYPSPFDQVEDNIVWKENHFQITKNALDYKNLDISIQLTFNNKTVPGNLLSGGTPSIALKLDGSDSYFLRASPMDDNEKITKYKIAKDDYINPKYSMEFKVDEDFFYYDYCKENNIEFPKKLIFYGYQIALDNKL